MDAWSNIEISSQDPEIIQIDQFEKKPGRLPGKTIKEQVHLTKPVITLV